MMRQRWLRGTQSRTVSPIRYTEKESLKGEGRQSHTHTHRHRAGGSLGPGPSWGLLSGGYPHTGTEPAGPMARRAPPLPRTRLCPNPGPHASFWSATFEPLAPGGEASGRARAKEPAGSVPVCMGQSVRNGGSVELIRSWDGWGDSEGEIFHCAVCVCSHAAEKTRTRTVRARGMLAEKYWCLLVLCSVTST